jgi:hypothetical protein
MSFPAASPIPGGVARWAAFAVRRRGSVLTAWVAFVPLGVVAAALGGADANGFSIPGIEEQPATDLPKARCPSQAGDSATIVIVLIACGSAIAIGLPIAIVAD